MAHPRAPHRRLPLPERLADRGEGDDGITTVLVALLLAGMLVISAVVIDGGRAYYQRRSMQNAADAAAMAGARALDRYRFSKASPSGVDAAIASTAAAHGAVNYECWLVNASGNRLTTSGSCDANTVAEAWGVFTDALAGVEVETTSTVTTFLASLADQPTMTSNADAAATIQPFRGGTGSPFLVCGKPSVNSDAYSLLDENNALNLDAIYANGWNTGGSSYIPLQGAQVPTCGANAAMKGENLSDTIIVGQPCAAGVFPPSRCEEAWAENGNGAESEIAVVVAGTRACTEEDVLNEAFASCDILVPVADEATKNGPATRMTAHVVRWISMRVSPGKTGLEKYVGTVNVEASSYLVSGGITGTGNVTDKTQARAIKLIR